MAEYSNTDNATVITGSAEADSITNSGATVTVSALGGDDTIDNTGSKVTIDAGADDDSITNTGSNVSISGGAGNNVINVNDGTGVTVNVASGYDTVYIGNDVSSITVKDFGENDEIQFIGGAITNFSTTSGGVIADDVTIAGLTAATSTQKWSSKTKYVETVTKGASLSSYGNSILYTPASETTLFTISGITSTVNVTVDTEDNAVTIGAGALTTSNVSISSGYTLVLGDDVEAPTTDSGWSISGTTYAYKETSTIAGYELDAVNNQIIYTPATNGATLVQLSGLKSEPYIDGNNIVLSADNFSSNVTVNSNANGYAFNLETGNYSKKSFTGTANANSISNSGSSIAVNGANGDDYIFNNGSNVTINAGNGDDTIVNEGDNISINGGAGDDSIDFNSGDDVTINVASGNDTINLTNVTSFVVQSFSSGDAIQLAALADSLGTVSGGITAGDVTISGITSLSTASNQLSLRSGVATYYTKTTAGATLNEDNDAIIYNAASTSNLFTLHGVTSTVGIDVSDTVVTISESALGTSNVSISSDDYKLALGSDVSSSSIADAWLQSGTAYAYGLSSTITGYDLDIFNNVINYTANKVGTTVVELTNIDISDNAPTVSATSVKLSADSFSGNVSVKSNSGNYKFELGEGSYSKRTFSGSANADSIYNDGSALSINGGAGDDFINNENTGSNVTISGGAGNDTISNIASNVTISGDAGADSISNLGDSVSINAGAGADSIYNSGDNVTILGDADNDNVYNNSGESVLFQYKGGNDTITGFGSTDTLQIVSGSIASAYSDGENAFLTVGKNVLTIEDLSTTTSTINVMNSKGSVSAYAISLVKGTDEDDYLPNYNVNVTINALAGNDDIDNFASSVTISGGADNDTIDSYYGDNVSINGGAGDDSININSGSNIVINVTEGNDTISLRNDNASISVEDFYSGDAIVLSNAIGALSSTSDGIIAGNVTISGLSIASVSSGWSLDGSNAHYVETYSTGVALGADKTSITYKADGEQTTIFTVTGVKDTAGLALNDDTIVVSSAALNQKDITVDNNYILSLGADVSAPEIVAEGWFNSDDNYVYKSTSTVAGYRSVSDNEIYYYDNAGGSALVELSGVGSEPNLSGNSVVLAAENFSGNVAVVSNANEYSFDIGTGDYEGKTFTATAKADTITNSGSNIGIISGNGNDLIDNSGENVTIDAGAGLDTIYSNGENAFINTGAGDDSIYNYGDLAIINAGAGNDNIENYGYSATISAGAGDDTVANYNNANDILFQYSGGNDVIEGFNDSSTLKISSGAISSAYFQPDSTDIFIAVGENTITLKDLATNKINLMTANDTVSSEYFIPILMGTNDPDNIQNDNYSNLEIQALAGDDTINNSGASVTIDGGADNDAITNSGSFVSINGGAGDDSIELSYSSDVTVNVASGNDTIAVGANISSFTVQEFSSGDRIELNIPASEMTSTKGGIIIDGDLTINGLTASNVTNEWSLESGVAKYYENRTAGVTLIDNNSAIVATVAGTTDIFTISGVASTVGIDVDDTSVTVSASALGTSNVSISSGYFLALGEDVASPEAVLEGWQVNGTTYTYKADSTLAGYELDGENNQIIYMPETGGETLVQISGIKNEPNIYENSITISAEDFSTNVTVNSNANNYAFELSQADYSGKSFIGTSGNDSVYNSGYNIIINAGAGNNIINNYGFSSTITAGKGNDSVVNNIYSDNVKISTGAGAGSIENYATYASVDAGANNDYITNEGHSSIFNGGAGDDTISNNSGTLDISINGGAGNDRIENDADGAILNGNADNDYIYNTGDSATINAGTGNDTIELYLSKDFENIIEYTSGDGDDVITVNSYNGGARLSIDLLSGTIGGYSTTEENDFVFQIDDGSLTFKNADEEIIKIRTPEGENYIWNGASNTTIGGGDEVNIIDNKGSYMTVQSSKGNDTVTLNADESSSNVYEYSRGKDIIYNYSDTDTIKIAGSSKVKVKINDDDLTLKVGAGSVTLKDAAKNQQLITVVNSADEIIISDTYTTDGKINADATAIELAENFNGTYTAEENITTVDGSNVLNKVRIIGNADYASSLVGGRRNDTLEGSPINSDTLTGGKGSDVFVYKGGPDVITYYEKRDKIRLENESPTVTGYAITGNDLTLGFGSDSLTIADGAGKVITFVQGSKTTRNIYTATGIFDGKQKAVSLSGSQSVFSAAKYSKLVTIDGSAAEDYINITGNSKKNYITAGEFGGTMTGGKGKDTLIASGAFDVFIYDKGDGKDVIEGYGTGDVVSLGSNVEIKDAKISRGNSVIKVASGSITINDTKIATLTSGGNDVIFNNGAFIDNKNSVVKVYGSYSDDISLADFGVTIADASEARKKLTITGDDSANSITGGKGKDSILGGAGNDSLVGGKGKDSLWGGAGNDTLAGGKGNDILYGDAGTDTFIFTAGDGNDTIADYENGELLSIVNKNGRAVGVSNSFNEDKGTLTLSVKGGGKLILTGVTSSTSVNINGTTKAISDL